MAHPPATFASPLCTGRRPGVRGAGVRFDDTKGTTRRMVLCVARTKLTPDSLVRHPRTKEVMSVRDLVSRGHANLQRMDNFSASGRGPGRTAHWVGINVPDEEKVVHALAGKPAPDSGFLVSGKVWKDLHQHLPPEPEESGPEYASQADLDHLFNDRRH